MTPGEAAAAGPALVAAAGLAAGHGGRKVLADVDLRIGRGERWYFLGPNGSGKTTLLRTLVGSLPPLAGSLERHTEVRRAGGLGFVPQRCELSPALPTTVREFVDLGLAGVRASRADRRERVARALARVALAGFEPRDFWSLSGGQRQRVLVARALALRPVLLVLDEPTAGLDVDAEEILLRSLDDLNRDEGVALLFVTHQVRLAAGHATHVALFGNGRVAAGPAPEVLNVAAFARAFGLAEDAAAGHLASPTLPGQGVAAAGPGRAP